MYSTVSSLRSVLGKLTLYATIGPLGAQIFILPSDSQQVHDQEWAITHGAVDVVRVVGGLGRQFLVLTIAALCLRNLLVRQSLLLHPREATRCLLVTIRVWGSLRRLRPSERC